MLIRLLCGRGVLAYLKLIACVLVTLFYFTFLFRESLHAYEQNKDKFGVAIGAANGVGIKLEIKTAPKLLRIAHHHQQMKAIAKQTTFAPVTPPSTLNPVYEYSEEIHSATERDLQQRRKHLNDVCERYNLQSLYPPNPWEFFISPGHSLVWCNVFKAASSTWMYYFNILGGYDIRYLQRTEMQPLQLARKRFKRPDLGELLDMLPSSVSFMFVRDPFERIVSAYRNKLELGRNSFYKTLGRKIIQQFRKNTLGVRPKSGPTFKEFLQFLIEQHAQKKRYDEHWAPVYRFCTPCSINFTIIGKIETFQRDSEFIIRQAGLESLLLGKLPKHKLRKIGNLASGTKTDELVERYFSEIDRETLDQLLKIYRLDFELFDYNYSKYYELVQPAFQTTTPIPSATIMQEKVDNATTTTAPPPAQGTNESRN